MAPPSGPEEYYVSHARLVQIENGDSVPSIHKLFSLSTIHGIDLPDLVNFCLSLALKTPAHVWSLICSKRNDGWERQSNEDKDRKSVVHDVRVKVSKGPKVHPAELVSVAIRPDVHVVGGGDISARDLALLKKWIEVNQDVIVKYWDGEIEYTEDAIAALKPVG